MKRLKIISLSLVMCVMAVGIALLGTVTYSRYVDVMSPSSGSTVAGAVVNYTRTQLTLTDSSGVTTNISLTDDSTIEIDDVEPEDVIDYQFSISDSYNKTYNEVLLQVTVSVNVALEFLNSTTTTTENIVTDNEGNTTTESITTTTQYITRYEFSSIEDYTDTNNYTQDSSPQYNAALTLYKKSGGNWVSFYKVATDANNNDYYLTEVDYSTSTIFVENSTVLEHAVSSSIQKEYTAHTNKFGFYLPPYAAAAAGTNSHDFRLQFHLPSQASDASAYSSGAARIVIEINIDYVQAIALTQ